MSRGEDAAERIDLRLVELRALQRRVDRRELEADDWPLVVALVSELELELATRAGAGQECPFEEFVFDAEAVADKACGAKSGPGGGPGPVDAARLRGQGE